MPDWPLKDFLELGPRPVTRPASALLEGDERAGVDDSVGSQTALTDVELAATCGRCGTRPDHAGVQRNGGVVVGPDQRGVLGVVLVGRARLRGGDVELHGGSGHRIAQSHRQPVGDRDWNARANSQGTFRSCWYRRPARCRRRIPPARARGRSGHRRSSPGRAGRGRWWPRPPVATRRRRGRWSGRPTSLVPDSVLVSSSPVMPQIGSPCVAAVR